MELEQRYVEHVMAVAKIMYPPKPIIPNITH
jgi:hypothetical protein